MNHFIAAMAYYPDDPKYNHPSKTLRCFGYYSGIDKAVEMVLQNYGDLHECLYNFLVIETLDEGIHPSLNDDDVLERWFEWQTDHWVEIAKPDWSRGYLGWSIG